MSENFQDPSGHEISLEQAVALTSRFRAAYPQLTGSAYPDALPFAETFPSAVFENLASLPGCSAIRAYLGLDGNQQVRLIFVAVNDQNEDILPGTGGGAIYEVGQRCPPVKRVI